MKESVTAWRILAVNTLAFTICFACWMVNGVLVTFLVENGVFDWDAAQMGTLIGVPVLTGSLMRLPVGMLTDRYGGRPVYATLMLLSAVPMFFLGRVQSYEGYLLASLGFGLTGAAFAVGIAFSSVWFSRERQGTALGIFGAGNAGAALTTLAAPSLLGFLTRGGEDLERWRVLPTWYAMTLVGTALIFLLLTENRLPQGHLRPSVPQMLTPLRSARVWRFGLYYFLVFGGFVALAQWLVPYYVNVYALPLVTAGLLTSVFSLPSGVVRALGGYVSDRLGARKVMYWVLGVTTACSFALLFPRMEIESPGSGVMASRGGVVTRVSETEIRVDDEVYPLRPPGAVEIDESRAHVWPVIRVWHVPQVEAGQRIERRALLARGVTNIFFQANVWIFTALVFVIGIAMGIGKAAVYKYIPEYFPAEVGVVGGMVGVIGGLGGFVCPIIFGYLLRGIGLWTSTWLFFLVLSIACLGWLHYTVRRMESEGRAAAPVETRENADRYSASAAS
ncbi:MAG: MFS transporter [Longimicrobiales bacterium]|nr:MFS transporter [Longimicrobiales bacterium]